MSRIRESIYVYLYALCQVLLVDNNLFSSQSMQLVTGFGDKEITKLAAHPEGKHFLALSAEGDVYSWGNGDGGRLGQGDNRWDHLHQFQGLLPLMERPTTQCDSLHQFKRLLKTYLFKKAFYSRTLTDVLSF